MRKVVVLLTGSLLAVLLLALLPAQSAYAYPPDVPSKSQVQSELNALTVRTESTMTGYSRDLFPHWIAISGTCDTRETVLKRDGSNVTVNSSCGATSGTWVSQWDNVTVTDPSTLDIDHVVPLAEAWRSGAAGWTTSRRQSFANDLNGPQLIAVTASSNRSKGDRDPAAWMPPVSSKHCAYAKMWIHTKYRWGLALQSTEKSALQTALNGCSY